MTSWRPEGVVLALLALSLLGAVFVRPVVDRYDDDQGNGSNEVRLPKVRAVGLPRTAAFFGAFTLLSFLYVGTAHPDLDRVYVQLIARLAALLSGEPPAISGLVQTPHLGIRFIVVAFFVCFALVMRGGILRRLAVLFNALLYAITETAVDSIIVAITAQTRFPLSPFGVEGNFAAVVVGVAFFLRFFLTTFALPRPAAVPRARRHYRMETATMSVVLLGAMISAVAIWFMIQIWSPNALWPIVIASLASSYFYLATYAELVLLQLLSPRPPEPGTNRPAIDVIIAAYNEEAGIAATLASIDRAAEIYAGPVNVYLADDGSVDRTYRAAEEAAAQFRAANARILRTPHEGKAHALNAALLAGSSDVVIRVDADTVVDERALLYSVPWFEDPTVGEVCPLTMPRRDLHSFYQRGRTLECLMMYGLTFMAKQSVDAMHCVPGTYSAFRRAPAESFGGFTRGMNGEDADLTMMLGRVGYRCVFDRRVRNYEDVPGTWREFREQRLRWGRAGLHVFARHAPVRAGWSGPRSWYSLLRIVGSRFTGTIRLLLIIHALQLVMLDPSYVHNLADMGALIVISLAPMLVCLAALAIVYGEIRSILYLPLWYPFATIRRIWTFVALMTLPPRPVRLPFMAPARQPEPHAVVVS
jgi:cellulose synthase/poly-beta-1,6-N-acetylglucosamine synthase-like glycosyltransferase